MTGMRISVCTYSNDDFEVIIKDDSDSEVTFHGCQRLTDEEFDLVNELAPACVFTRYVQEKGQ